MIKNLKNWWLQIVTIAIGLLDLGFEVINPLLLEIGISEKTTNIIKILFVIFALLKSKLQLPTKNVEKLKTIVEQKTDDSL